MAAEDIHVRLCLQDIIKLDLEAKALIQDIRDHADTAEVLEDLSGQAREKFNKLRAKIDDLARLGHEQDTTADKEAILTNVKTLKQTLSGTLTSLRQANLATQLTIERKTKEQLLDGGTQVRHRGQGNKETLAKMAGDITESLLSLNRTMASQVQHSETTMTSLVNSSSSVGEIQDEFQHMGGHIQHSHRLLTKYGRREFTDKLLIFLALVLFFGTVLYIVKKRIWPS
ncbi:vesicle transport protein SEC20-like [Littorina saxatilis]|uniref:Sec20 C-terminal domain-containing protein n=1 Tax=Littorina saxatilis TaxID=31220 RepID=A0AAN9BQK7_9CAEN